jgi:glyoxylase-like metal-dependent hydrolase (beta-lactamase superfamily II)
MREIAMSQTDVEEVLYLLSRRRFLAAGAAFAATPLISWKALAQSQAPYAFKQGDFDITVISDGELTLPMNVFLADATPEEQAEIAKRLGWTPPNATGRTNHAVLKAGSDVILVDTGSGSKLQPTAGKMPENLKASGIDPASITKVVLTHAHPDHIWGTTDAGGAFVFPNATYYVGATEWDFWTAPDLASKMPPEMTDIVKGSQRELAAVKDKVVMLKPGDDVVTGLRALDTFGHTPGHLSFEVSGGEGLIITADASTSEVVALEHPGWKFVFDAVPDLAIENRKKLLDRAATDKIKLIGYHWTSPGVGFAERNGDAYRFVPAS